MRRGFAPITLLPFVTLALIGFFVFSFTQSPVLSERLFGEVTYLFQRVDVGEELTRFIVVRAGEDALASLESFPSREVFAPVFLRFAEQYRLKEAYSTNLYGLLQEGTYTFETNEGEGTSTLIIPDVIVRVAHQGHEVTRTFTLRVVYDRSGKVRTSKG